MFRVFPYSLGLLIALCFSVGTRQVFGQQGRLQLHFEQVPYNDTLPVEVRVYRAPSELVFKDLFYTDHQLSVDSLLPGLYDVKFYRAGILRLEHHAVKVAADSSTELSIFLDVLDPGRKPLRRGQKNYTTMNGDNPGNFALFVQTFQPPFSSQNETVKSTYAFGIKATPLYQLARWYAIGANFSTGMATARCKKIRSWHGPIPLIWSAIITGSFLQDSTTALSSKLPIPIA